MGELSVLPEAAESVLQELCALHLCRRQKRRQVVVSFWGFGSTPLRDKLLAGLRHALRTEKVYCSDVGPQRFEGIVCVCRRQLSSLRQLATHVRMGMEVLELLRCSRCLQCEAETVRPALLASVARIHSGTSTQGHHPVSWGKGFKDAFEQMQLRDSVLQVTGVELDAHNMTMLYMAQQATDHGLQYYRTRCRHVQRERGRRRDSRLAPARENPHALRAAARVRRRHGFGRGVSHGDVRGPGGARQQVIASDVACI